MKNKKVLLLILVITVIFTLVFSVTAIASADTTTTNLNTYVGASVVEIFGKSNSYSNSFSCTFVIVGGSEEEPGYSWSSLSTFLSDNVNRSYNVAGISQTSSGIYELGTINILSATSFSLTGVKFGTTTSATVSITTSSYTCRFNNYLYRNMVVDRYNLGYNNGITYADSRVNTASASYTQGYNDGVIQGASENNSYSQGYTTGLQDGISQANSSVNTSSASYTAGVNQGVVNADSRVNSSSASYIRGKQDGINSANEYSFDRLFGAIFDAPVQALVGLLSFDVFGVDMSAVYLSLFTLCIIFLIVRLCIK